MQFIPRFSIRTKFFLTIVVFTTFLLVLTDTIWITQVRPIILESAIDAQKAEVDRLSFRTRNFIDAKVRLLILLSQSAPFLDQKTEEQIPELLNSFKQDADILELAVLDRFGKEIAKVDRNKTYAQNELGDRSQDLAYKFAAFGFGTEYFSEVSFDGTDPVMIISIPIIPVQSQRRLENISTQTISGETPAFITQKGIIVAKITLRNLYKALETSRPKQEIFIINTDGLLITTQNGAPDEKINLSTSVLAPHFDNLIEHIHSLSEVPSIIDSKKEVYSTHAIVPDLKWVVLVEEPTSTILANVNQLAVLAVLIVIGGIIIAFILAQFISLKLTKPLENLSYAAGFIGKGDFTHRVIINTGDELEKLGQAFNGMAGLIQKQIEDLKRVDKLKDEFIALVSHNLRTPLTSLKGYTEIIKKSPSLSSDDTSLLAKITSTTALLEKLVEEVLTISSIGPNGMGLHLVTTNIESLIKEAIHEVEIQAVKKGITIQTMITPNLPEIAIDVRKVQDVLANLLDNAIKYSPEHTKIEVYAQLIDNMITVSVKDQGIGIDEAEVPRLFQKFHRASDYMIYQYKGIGLGLYYCKLVIESHGGKIWINSIKGTGSIFSFTLPVTQTIKTDPNNLPTPSF